MDKVSTTENLMLFAGTSVGIANIETILGWIILFVQVVWLIIKLIVKIKTTLDMCVPIDELDDEVDEIVDAISDAKESMKNEHTDFKP